MTQPALLPLSREFLARLAATAVAALPLLRGAPAGGSVSGSPEEFDGYRAYLPGDDVRGIDWNLYARSGELFVKLFRFEEEVEVVLLLDESPSMLSGDRRKHRYGAAAAAALAYLGFLTSHPVTLVRYAGRALELSGPHRRLDAFPILSRRLLAPAGGAGTDLLRSLQPLVRAQRPMTFIALTDGFQREPLLRVAATVTALRHARLVVLFLEEEADRRPPLRGNLLVADDESPERIPLLSDRYLEHALHRDLDAHFAAVEHSLRRSGALVLRLPVRPPFEERFLGLLRVRRSPAPVERG